MNCNGGGGDIPETTAADLSVLDRGKRVKDSGGRDRIVPLDIFISAAKGNTESRMEMRKSDNAPEAKGQSAQVETEYAVDETISKISSGPCCRQ